jgi:hypothetical protein
MALSQIGACEMLVLKPNTCHEREIEAFVGISFILLLEQ